ncbi:MFS transporter [Streptomyces drozdowiczii]
MPLALLALAIGAFGIGTTEFVVMGLLPEVAAEFQVSIPAAGFLATGYALGVVLGAPLMTVLGTKVSRKRMLMILMGLFIIGNVVTAAAPVFEVMVVGRVIASLAHGAFFGIGAVVAADLVAPERKAGAIALMFTGLTVANVVGVPMGTYIGQNAGWRATFYVSRRWASSACSVWPGSCPNSPALAASGCGRRSPPSATCRSSSRWR